MAILMCLSVPPAAGQSPAPVFDTSGFDWSVRPQDDFFQFVNGEWLERTEIPEGRMRAGSFWGRWVTIQQTLRGILRDMAGRSDVAPARRKLADYFVSYMDTSRIEAVGLGPSRDELNRIESLNEHRELAAHFAHFARIGVERPLFFSIDRNPDDADEYISVIGASGLGLPDQDYYTAESERQEKVRSAYLEYIERLLDVAGHQAPANAAADILALEDKLAEQHARSEEADTPEEILLIPELKDLAPDIDWETFLRGVGLDPGAKILVRQPEYLEALGDIIRQTPMATWRDYLTARLLVDMAPVLDRRFVDAHFEFESVRTGLEHRRPRRTRALLAAGAAFTDVLSRVYADHAFQGSAEATIPRVEEMVAKIRQAFCRGIEKADWASPSTKRAALTKLDDIIVRIGVPKRRVDYSTLDIDSGDLVGNTLRLAKFDHRKMMRHLDHPVDPEDLIFPAYAPDAFAVQDQIIFPAAFLHPPFFYPEARGALNYGALGSTIGHEIGHHFDYGSITADTTKMAPSDSAAFKARADLLAAQFSAYNPIDTLHIDGRLTLDENMSDLAGLAAAYRAYKRLLDGGEPAVAGGFTGVQRFFLGFALAHRVKLSEALLRSYVRSNPHAPPRYRINGALRNVPAFYRAFDVEPSDGMYLPPEERVAIW